MNDQEYLKAALDEVVMSFNELLHIARGKGSRLVMKRTRWSVEFHTGETVIEVELNKDYTSVIQGLNTLLKLIEAKKKEYQS